MKQTKIMMDMPITVEIIDAFLTKEIFDKVFSYFEYIDNTFSTYKNESEISLINQGKIGKNHYSHDMKIVFSLSEETKRETNGYFNICYQGKYDPSGLVKGWAIYNVAKLLQKSGFKNFYIDAGGDIQISGKNKDKPWRVGIRNPFKSDEIVKVLILGGGGVATSGTYIRGQHIYNPREEDRQIEEVVSLTVVGPNVFDADRFATAAFAMGMKGIEFIENLKGFEGYMIDRNGLATFTSGFNKYTALQ
jgi:thiamine biosynthesis lipoprotein